jgi:hypothetical protein
MIYNSGDFNIQLNEFIDMYADATHDKYNFLYADITGGTYRKNFNKEYRISAS